MVIKKVPWQVLGHDHERSGAAYLVLASGDLGLKDAEADFSHSHHNSEDGISNFKTNNKKSSKNHRSSSTPQNLNSAGPESGAASPSSREAWMVAELGRQKP